MHHFLSKRKKENWHLQRSSRLIRWIEGGLVGMSNDGPMMTISSREIFSDIRKSLVFKQSQKRPPVETSKKMKFALTELPLRTPHVRIIFPSNNNSEGRSESEKGRFWSVNFLIRLCHVDSLKKQTAKQEKKEPPR